MEPDHTRTKSKWSSLLRYTFRKWQSWVLLLVVSSLILALFTHPIWTRDRLFGDFLDPVFGILTAISATIAAFIANQNEWEEGLEKRLDVFFVINEAGAGRVVMACREAYLANEGDIRNWALQIGRQWGGQLSIEPVIDLDPARICVDAQGAYKRHGIYLFLSQLPPVHRSHTFHLWLRQESSSQVHNQRSYYNSFPSYAEIKQFGIDHWINSNSHAQLPQ